MIAVGRPRTSFRAGLAGALLVALAWTVGAPTTAQAETRGYADRVRFVEGDFVELAGEIEAADLVTLDRVVCCYPDMPALVGSAARLTRRALGLVMPRGTRFMRAGVAVANLFLRLRRHPFRIYVHDPREVEAVLAEHGLERRYVREGLAWRVAVFHLAS